MNRHFLTTCLVAWLSCHYANIWAQVPEFIKFDKTEHDFGVRKEEEKELKYEFKFKNVSATPVKLTYVKASCGCTTPTWTKDEIKPGGVGSIVATYGASNRPGKFDKVITVRASTLDNINEKGEDKDVAKSQTLMLKIKGDVTPRVKGPEDWYPFKDGNLWFSTNHAAFGDIYTNEKKTKDFVIYNAGKKPIRLDSVTVGKKHIKYEFLGSKTINPKDSTKMRVSYDATKVGDYDFLHERASLITNDDTLPNKNLYISASVKEYFDEKSKADTLNGPRAKFDKLVYDYGEINEGDKASTAYVLTNVGKADLIIRKSKASCGCTASQPEKMLLKPGESTKINVTFDSTGKPGEQQKDVTVVTNDPVNPVYKLKIKGKVNKKEGDGAATPAPGH
jgi:hypothetical protein